MISFFVPGIPVPKGSARAFMRSGMRFPVIVQDNAPKQKTWARAIALACKPHVAAQLAHDPVAVRLLFIVERPKSHFGKNGIKETALRFPKTRPDLDKYVRCVLDALTGIVWQDDSQVVKIQASKDYAAQDNVPGCAITIWGMAS